MKNVKKHDENRTEYKLAPTEAALERAIEQTKTLYITLKGSEVMRAAMLDLQGGPTGDGGFFMSILFEIPLLGISLIKLTVEDKLNLGYLLCTSYGRTV